MCAYMFVAMFGVRLVGSVMWGNDIVMQKGAHVMGPAEALPV